MATYERTRKYHHGDLATALTDVATELARTGGPGDVVLREAARRVGVSATAAYRHFAGHQELMHTVKDRALGELAAAMRAEVERSAACADPLAEAVRRLRALGRTYIEFATREPGLFRTAFCPDDFEAGLEEQMMNAAPYQMLSANLDELAALGALAPENRPFAEIRLWSTVHGGAQLMLDGPLRMLGPDDRSAVIDNLLDFCLSGLGVLRPAG